VGVHALCLWLAKLAQRRATQAGGLSEAGPPCAGDTLAPAAHSAHLCTGQPPPAARAAPLQTTPASHCPFSPWSPSISTNSRGSKMRCRRHVHRWRAWCKRRPASRSSASWILTRPSGTLLALRPQSRPTCGYVRPRPPQPGSSALPSGLQECANTWPVHG
jgi:hypothetical protein